MNKIFPLEYGESRGIIFDVHDSAGDFVLLYTGAIEKFAYGSGDYFKNNPVLSWKLIEAKSELLGRINFAPVTILLLLKIWLILKN